jgi:hypothetical protein
MKHNVEEMRKQAPTDPMHVMKGTGKVAANKLDETTSLGGSVGGRHCPSGIDGQPSMRYTDPDGQVYTHSTDRSPEENDEIRALAGSMSDMMSMTSTTNTLALFQPSAFTLPTMNLRTCSQIDDNELMAMIISALESGVRSMSKFQKVHRVTGVRSLEHWVGQNGRPSWTELKNMHPLTDARRTRKGRRW